MLSEFKAFIAKGNVLDLAVAVIIGAAFATIVASLTDDIIMPVVGAIFGGLDFSNHFTVLGDHSRRLTRAIRPAMPRSRPPASRCSAGASS